MKAQGDNDLAERGRQRVIAGSRDGLLVRSRALVGLLLLISALMWALLRGLHFYGVSPVHLVYDLDQPPWLLLLVGGWLAYRSRRP